MSVGLRLQAQASRGRDFTNKKGLTIGHGASEEKESNPEATDVSLPTSLFNAHLVLAHGIVQSRPYKWKTRRYLVHVPRAVELVKVKRKYMWIAFGQIQCIWNKTR